MDDVLVEFVERYPIVNGQVFRNSSGEMIVNLPDVGEGVQMSIVSQFHDDHNSLHYSLHNLPSGFVLRSFGVQFEVVNIRAFLRHGYFSWDGSYYVGAEELPVGTRIQGYAMTQLLPLFGEGSLIIGYNRHDRFQHTITLERTESGFTLSCETLWDEREHDPAQPYESERLLIMPRVGNVEDALRDWARIVATTMNARADAPPQLGWCSWYNLYGYITEENILEHLHSTKTVAACDHLPMQIFQIDDGFTPEMGDWLDVKPQFPRGMKPLLDDIRAAGFTPGLWIAPFMVGNRSKLFRQHPDWVVKDRLTGKPLAHMTFYAEFRWHKRSEEYYILDVTHPDALGYISEVFRIWHEEWGCDYFKTDFMHFGSEYGPDRAQWYQGGMTRIEIWRTMGQAIRANIDDAFWLGCGCPLWASVGLVDGVRIGRDVGVTWDGDSMAAQSLLRDQATRNFANGILWQADPDCILIREQFHHLTNTELESLAIYAGMSSGLVLTSDDLAVLSDERLQLWKLLLSTQKAQCDFPLLGQTPLVYQSDVGAKSNMRALDPVLVQVRRSESSPIIAVFILNTGETGIHRVYPLSTLGFTESYYEANWMKRQTEFAYTAVPTTELRVKLSRHEGVLFFLSTEEFESVPQVL